ncbi:hypothetical protein KFJ24_10930 [Marinobacter sediminum]|uniref:hypothetical protein n=1 Tax=Marinobacter sediminum TaxID=256323 RepID=UPI00202DD508|nr:hypothetical protein [Marinobacter sediminum]MCM0612985.1 hypothetical protein [Marinobacter sediminum]
MTLLSVAISPHPLADDQTPPSMPLDGKSFQSSLGPMGQPADVDDLLVFEDGQFVSAECERRCGYAKVEYWVRAHDDGIQMRAEVPCADSAAVMYWRGTVRGDEIEGSFTWVNKRWYWTFEKEFWFKGRLVEADNP